MACSNAYIEDRKDKAISKVLDLFVKRPTFINLQYGLKPNPSTDIALALAKSENIDIELVGSSNDGLKVGRAFDVGDVDAIAFSDTVSFDKTDEATFEYRTDDPSFFCIPQPKVLPNLIPVEGKYLNANYLRTRHPDIFRASPKSYRSVPFNLIPTHITVGAEKCAITAAVPYSDPVADRESHSDLEVDHRLFMSWDTEHVLLTHLLLSTNGEKIKFVKELLFGSEMQNTIMNARNQLKNRMAFWKEDFHRCKSIVFDMLYFRSSEVVSVISEATDPDVLSRLSKAVRTDPHGEYSIDIVPAIKCTGIPRPAQSFLLRERRWPPEEIVRSVVEQGYQVVAKAPAINPHPEKDFLLSFSPAEKQIANALPEQAKMSYCFLKMCFKCAKEKIATDAFKTFHLKTALFWVAEKTDPHCWDDNGLLLGIRSIAQFVIDSLKKQNLPSYFVPTNNLIRHFSDEDRESTLEMFQLIHDNPANFAQLVIDKEWEFSRATMSPESFKKVQEPGFFHQFSWTEEIKFYCYTLGLAGNYPLYEMMDNMDRLKSESFYEQYATALTRQSQGGNIPFLCHITEDQLKYVDIFVQTVTQNDIDLFNVIDRECEEDIVNSTESWLPKETLAVCPNYNAEEDERFGELFNATIRLRLKFYANVFHIICIQLMRSRYQQPQTIKNQDAVYIINFLNQLVQRRAFSDENIEDLLHFMLYFCHFTRLRHYKLSVDEQILRGMREFLMDAKHMMTVYFNPRELYPLPVDVGDKIDTILGECFPRKEQVNQCGIN